MAVTSHLAVDVIRKDPRQWRVQPNLVDYEAARASFTWDAAAAPLDGLPRRPGPEHRPRGVDRHAAGARGATASRCAGSAADGRRPVDHVRGRCRDATNRFANVLAGLGVEPRRPGLRAPGPGARAVRRACSAR